MPEITAADVKALRDRTGLPMMDCKKALQECDGDAERAIAWIREQNIKTQAIRSDRETSFGRVAVYADVDAGVGAMVELLCESAPVAGSDEIKRYANDLARQLATGPGAATGEELLGQPSPSQPGATLGEVKDDMFNRIREVFKVGRVVRIDAPTGGYAHHDGSAGALVEVEGGTTELAKDVAMHVVAQRPSVTTKEELDPADTDRERDILTKAAKTEGKPDNIIAKMVEGRMKNFYAANVLLEQPFVKDDSKTVGALANENKMKVKRFIRWELGK